MKKLKLLLVIMLAATLTTQAQGQRRTVEERVKMTMDRITDSLKLDAKELPATTTAFTDYYTAQNKLREGLAEGTRPDKTQMDKLTSERDAALQKIWTADQFKRYKEMEANMRQRGGGGQKPPGQ
jgi:hypothetical protein